MQGHGIDLHPWLRRTGIKKPLRRVALVEIDKLQRYGKVDQVQVQIVQTQITQRLFAGRSHMLRPVIRIPEFRRHPQIFALTAPGFDRSPDSFSGLPLITIIGSAVEMPVTGFDGSMDHARSLVSVYLPQTETDRREGIFSNEKL